MPNTLNTSQPSKNCSSFVGSVLNAWLFLSLVIFFNLFIAQTIHAQEGSPFQTNFISNDESMAENYSICYDKEGMVIVANRKGILTFDANEWKLIQTPELPISVAFEPTTGTVFVGCRNSIGYLVKNKFGDYEFIKIAGNEAGVAIQIAFVGNYVYFLSPTVITRVDKNNLKNIQFWKSKPKNPFNTMFELNGKLLVDVAELGLEQADNSGLKPFMNNFPLTGKVLFSIKYDTNTTLLGASDNKLYLYDGKIAKLFVLQDQQYLSDATIVDAKQLDVDKIVDQEPDRLVYVASFEAMNDLSILRHCEVYR